MMVGPAGSGKSQAAHQAALALGLRFFAQSVCAQTTASQLLGYMDATGHYVRSLFREAYENGGVYLLDEIDAGNANVLAVLNSSLSNGQCAFPDGMINRNESFRAVATANTWGLGRTVEYIGRQPIDAATLDRFASVSWGYDAGVESAMCPDDRWRNFVIGARAEVERRQVRHLITPRASLYGHRMILAGLPPKTAAEMLVFKGLEQDARESIKQAIPPELKDWFNGEVASA
jgi:cobaltochelatase CobS